MEKIAKFSSVSQRPNVANHAKKSSYFDLKDIKLNVRPFVRDPRWQILQKKKAIVLWPERYSAEFPYTEYLDIVLYENTV